MVRAAIVGVSGYAGGELARLLGRHPEVEVVYAASETYAGKPLSKAFPGLSGTATGKILCERFETGHATRHADVVFLAQESGAAMRVAGEILAMGKRIVDISADFRIRNVEAYEKWYKIDHEAPLLLEGTAIYGLPEINRDYISGAHLVANPGCFPTAAILALAPLLSKKLIRPSGIVVDAKSGISGAGRAKHDAIYRFAEADNSVLPYGVGGIHRHVPEIEQELSASAAPDNVTITFTPHLVPMTRGLLATCYAPLVHRDTTTESVLEALHAAYASAPFVIVRDAGDYPSTKDVHGSNFCHIAAKVDARTGTVIVTSAIDNLVKGAAGQAVQNMNLMFGLPETTGLEAGAVWP